MIRDPSGLLTRPTHARFLFYKVLTAIPVSVAVIAMVRYAGICLGHVAVMFTSKCPSCAYYKTGKRLHRCFMIWGLPKIIPEREGPAPGFLRFYVPVAILTLTGYPVFWLRFEWELLLVYLLSVVVVLCSINMQECSRCISFGCPNNSVPEEIRQAYLEKQV